MTLIGMNDPLPQAQQTRPKTDADYPTRLGEIAPGSLVQIGGPRVGGAPFRATVLQTYESMGATGTPAIFVAPEHDKSNPLLINEAARYEVTVIADASSFVTDQVPADAVRVQIRPVHGVAMRFTGGIDSATKIITWCLGRGAPSYDRGSDTDDEVIRFGGLGATGGICRVGDWVVLHDDDTFHIVSDLAAVYDEES